MRQEKSSSLFRHAQTLFPGGVNSPVRAFRKVGGEPFFVASAEGARLTDVDGNIYIDYVMSWGPLMLGHAHPLVVRAIQEAVVRGTSYGAPNASEVELAELVMNLVPSIEMLRFVNSGTEATMAAVRVARGVTRRDLILKFTGCYHGHGDSFLVHAGSGVATLGLPDSPGVPADLAKLTLTVPYNDVAAVEETFAQQGDRIACVIVEPIVGNGGFIPPADGFLQRLRTLTAEYGSLLIFDEVMTGFRVAPGGAQELYGIKPDLTTLGKVIGAGLPVGAFGGRRDLMSQVAPTGPIYQAGTLSGNPLAMAAGIAQLRALQENPPYDAIEARGRKLLGAMVAAGRELGIPVWGDVMGAMWGFHFAEGPVRSFEQAKNADGEYFNRFFWACLRRGVFFPASPFEASFLSAAHDDATIAQTIEQVQAAMKEATQ
ncbi:MAG TPA: glutamate-1-semialdehyde 2,1-aminomutase [Longimicrobiales bacterium]|nr:glutamate-1-semialdehyde 2,1-aminomutase [Longimicrobiales bacterium]